MSTNMRLSLGHMLRAAMVGTLLLLAAAETHAETGDAPDAQQAVKDASTVEALMRLPSFDVNASPPVKAAVLRYLAANRGSQRYLELIERFQLRDMSSDLLALVLERTGDTTSVAAARLLVKLGDRKLLQDAVRDDDEQCGANAAGALGYISDREANQFLAEVVLEQDVPLLVRSAAAKGLARNRDGERKLLEMVTQKQMPSDLNFGVANLLHASRDAATREAVARHLPLPAAAQGDSLPPMAELVQRSGDPQGGKEIFSTKGTCAKCHRVAGEGKEVGPDLTEIGTKLSKEAIYLAVLDPSAAVSHNYETYEVVTSKGQIANGLLVSRTDDEIRLKNNEGVELAFKTADIDEVIKLEVSLMPNGLQQNMTVAELVDLVQYLSNLKKAGG